MQLSINWSIRNLPLRYSAIFVCEAGQDLVGLLTSATVPASKALLSVGHRQELPGRKVALTFFFLANGQ